MTLDEIYEKYPEAKEQAEENIRYWGSQESLDEQDPDGELDDVMKVYGGEEELHNFFQQIVSYDAFLLKENEITPWQEERNNRVIEHLTDKHLGFWHDALYRTHNEHQDKFWQEDQMRSATAYKIFLEDTQ